MNVRIQTQKNLAFEDQPDPLETAEVAKEIKPRKPASPVKSAEIELDLMLPTSGTPKVEAVAGDNGGGDVRLRIGNFRPGVHVFPPGTKTQAVEPLGNKSRTLSKPLEVEAFLPEHLALRPVPQKLPAALKSPPFIQALAADEREAGNQATTVFAPENRRVFHDTAYPWSCCGRVDTPNGQGSGVMVGPRHLLTVSHVIRWNSDGTTGWIRFIPSYFDGSAPFGTAWGVLTYFKYKVDGPTIDWIEGMYDYVCVVLNWPIGNWTGWHGTRGYTDSWDGGAYWAHIGYPGDLTAGNRPTFENGISLDGAWWEFDSHEAMSHHGDVWPGQSGGPFFGWWSGEVGPRAVAVQSSQNSSENNASGGQDLVDLVIRARNEHP
ncbi:MAG TPA: hypothetical protein VH306_07780 [Gaiellaceae bacterium]|jgi:V8-like Glu-specific endopeptidase